jgi:hypothetical protein
MSDPSKTLKLSSTQIGTIGENILANSVMKSSKGRLSAFKPVADDDGLDVLFFDKQTGKSIAIQFKSRAVTDARSYSKLRGHTAQFNVRLATINKARRAYLVAALLNEDMTEFVYTWFISMKQLQKIGKLRSKDYVITPSKAPDSRDKYVPYRCLTDVLAQKILKECNRRASGTVLS